MRDVATSRDLLAVDAEMLFNGGDALERVIDLLAIAGGVKLDLAALEEYLRATGPEAGESTAERGELLAVVREARASRTFERKKWHVRTGTRKR